MLRLTAAVAAVAAGTASAQTTVTPQPNIPSPFVQSGTAVGKPMLSPIGGQLPSAAPAVGKPVGYLGPDGKQMPLTPPPPGGKMDLGKGRTGQVIDLNNLAAPVTGPLPPGLSEPPQPSLWDKAYAKWRSAFGLDKPTQGASYTPGISRRNRERREREQMLWRRD